jgi:hypothetical protein
MRIKLRYCFLFIDFNIAGVIQGFVESLNSFLETFCIGAYLFTVDVNMEKKLENELYIN